jgi:hypothetical protein
MSCWFFLKIKASKAAPVIAEIHAAFGQACARCDGVGWCDLLRFQSRVDRQCGRVGVVIMAVRFVGNFRAFDNERQKFLDRGRIIEQLDGTVFKSRFEVFVLICRAAADGTELDVMTLT